MDFDIPESSSICTTRSTKTVKQSLQCHVCGENDAKMHYGTLCCPSCKIFFRRNARVDHNGNQCAYGGRCEITVLNRQGCRFCRLKKCLSVGMQEVLLRSSYSRSRAKNVKKKQLNQETNSTDVSNENIFSLIHNDRSSLTIDQWSLLSNVVNTYDDKSPITMIRNISATNYAAYPMKTRVKMAAANMLEVLSMMYRAMGLYFEAIPHFSNLSRNDRTALLERNFQNTSFFAGTATFQDAGVYSSDMFKLGFPSLYGPIITNQAMKIVERQDYDGTVLKLIAPVLMFSTNSTAIVTYNMNSISGDFDNRKSRQLSNTIDILHIQNMYVEMMFKYMIYRFGYDQAALRFATLIRTFLVLCTTQYLARQEITLHDQMTDTVVNEIERLLIIQDEITH